MKTINLTQGKVALVDDHWFDELNKYKWCYVKSGYAVRSIRTGKKIKRIWMHRVVNNTPEGSATDHINHNKCDNQESNLRDASIQENCMNRHKNTDNSSGYKGVTSRKNGKYYEANIKLDGKKFYIGNYNNKNDAALAYNKKALELFGEFAFVNVIV